MQLQPLPQWLLIRQSEMITDPEHVFGVCSLPCRDCIYTISVVSFNWFRSYLKHKLAVEVVQNTKFVTQFRNPLTPVFGRFPTNYSYWDLRYPIFLNSEVLNNFLLVHLYYLALNMKHWYLKHRVSTSIITALLSFRSPPASQVDARDNVIQPLETSQIYGLFQRPLTIIFQVWARLWMSNFLSVSFMKLITNQDFALLRLWTMLILILIICVLTIINLTIIIFNCI